MIEVGYLPKKYWSYLTVTAVLSLLFEMFPYNRYAGILIQFAIVGMTIVFYLGTPVVALAAVLMLRVIPSTIFYASNSDYQTHYQLNSKMIIIMCVLLFFNKIRKQRFVIIKNRISSLTLLLAVYMLVSRLITGNSVYYTSDFYVLPVLYICISFFIENRYDVRFAWLSFSVATMVLISRMLSTSLYIGTIYIINATIDRNYLAMVTIICFMMTMTSVFYRGDFANRLYLIIALITSMAAVYLVLTYASRTAFILMTCFVAFLLIYAFFNNKKAVIIICIFTLVAIRIGTKTDAAVFLLDRFSNANLSSANGRTDIASRYLLEFASENILFKLFGQGYKVFSADFNGVKAFAHNSYLGMLIDFGLLGVGLYIFTLIRTLERLWRSQFRILVVSYIVMMVYMLSIEIHQDIAGVCYLMTCAGIADANYLVDQRMLQPMEVRNEKNPYCHSGIQSWRY